jgi:glyoxylase-like metal-dependent hydrolase (beta-lactamase superfamily II)
VTKSEQTIMETASDNSSHPQPEVAAFFEAITNTFSYVVNDPSSGSCAIIDSVLNFDHASGSVSYESADKMVQFIREKSLKLEWIIETHVHADHISAAPYLQKMLGGKLAIGEKISHVQDTFAGIFNLGNEFARNGCQFDQLFKDGDCYQIGSLIGLAVHTPGHTPACMTHVIGNTAFVGDTLFMPDSGTARADFPGGDAKTLYQSIQKILSLPGDTRLFMCHDYCPNGRNVEYETTVTDQLANNIHINASVDENAFIQRREARDKTLGMPKLILPALQVNMSAGYFPQPESNNITYLKLPINALK